MLRKLPCENQAKEHPKQNKIEDQVSKQAGKQQKEAQSG